MNLYMYLYFSIKQNCWTLVNIANRIFSYYFSIFLIESTLFSTYYFK